MSSHDVRPETEITDPSVCADQYPSSDSRVAAQIAAHTSEVASEAQLCIAASSPGIAGGLDRASIASATPDKRKRASMARRGQVGKIEVSGKWFVVRFWRYPAGQPRFHASEKICPVDPSTPGYLPKGARRRRASEIVEASGVNDTQNVVDTTHGVTFREQASWFLNHSTTRKRNPVKPKLPE